MALAAGERVGAYEVVALIGAGGMGEVYRARDTKLKRDVALKVLPDAVAGDPERMARFQREAEVLASLNHPNIAAIYGVEERALAMELVDGETLEARLKARPPLATGARGFSRAEGLAVDEALAIARQIADALEVAHEKGIVHRDLKPANIMLTADGHVKVLDFGLAKIEPAGSGAGGQAGLTQSPTLTFAGTQTGVILGTAAYMAPEQAKGRPADKRSDVWAFGCMLYEMLAGRRAFEGEDVSDTLAAVLRGEPDWSALAPNVPAHIRSIIERCLAKDRKARIPDIVVVRYLMTETRGALSASDQTKARGIGSGMVVAIASIVAAVSVAATWRATRPAPPAKITPTRFTVARPSDAGGGPVLLFSRDLVISPDGTRIVYAVGNNPSNRGLMMRALDRLESVPLRGLERPTELFVSPDGHWIGFAASGEIKKMPLNGGPAATVCRLPGTSTMMGASWGPDDTIVFGNSTNQRGTLFSVPAAGGEPKALLQAEQPRNETYAFPSVLPTGRAVLFTIVPRGPIESAEIAALDLATRQRKTLIRGGTQAEYVDTSTSPGRAPAGSAQPGYLVYAAAGTLRAVRFDAVRLEVLGEPVSVVEQVLTKASGAADFSISQTGTLAYVPGGAITEAPARSLVWVDRQGREQPITAAPPRGYTYPRLSPDSSRIAFEVRDQDNDIWVWEFARETLTRLTFDPAADTYPVWTPDGRRIIFSSLRTGNGNLFAQQADGSGSIEQLTSSPNDVASNSISPDGKEIVVRETAPKTGNDIMLVRAGSSPRSSGADSVTEPLVATRFSEQNGELSRDGRWLAYQSDESGRQQVYVRPFPNVDAGRWQVSTTDGSRPLWARNGRELFYLDANGAVMAVPVETTPTFSARKPTKLFDWKAPVAGQGGRTYDVSPDGKRFLMIKDLVGDRPSATAPLASITVVLNWIEELKQRVPAGK